MNISQTCKSKNPKMFNIVLHPTLFANLNSSNERNSNNNEINPISLKHANPKTLKCSTYLQNIRHVASLIPTFHNLEPSLRVSNTSPQSFMPILFFTTYCKKPNK
jgi:hypothetical protein